MSSFKGSKRARDVADGNSSAAKRARRSNVPCGEHATKVLLQERGYRAQHIEVALRECGPALTRCESYIEQLQAGMSTENFNEDVVSEELWAHNVMHEIGFSEGDIAFALQLASDNFAKALGHRVHFRLVVAFMRWFLATLLGSFGFLKVLWLRRSVGHCFIRLWP